MNKTHRIVWSESRQSYIVAHEKSAFGSRPGATLALSVALMLGMPAHAAPGANELPAGGNVLVGSASISTNGNRMEVLQTTQRTAIDWNTFNIGSAAHVHFQQPTGGAALNRVLDTNASEIYGKLTSTGQVFLVNPNGVFFAPGAQVDVGGLVVSTLAISNSEFMAGNYAFHGSSSNAIINQGSIKVGSGGTVALIAARITNDGSIEAPHGNVLLGAGSKVTLDMGGPVKLQIENDALETLIKNGGAIKADGGVVWLSSQAAKHLANSVINNTGLIEAQTLTSGEKGEIILFAHDGNVNIAGILDASAPNGGDGGFIETSGSKVFNSPDLHVTTLAPYGQTGNWLIDPATYTVASSGGDETGAALAGRLAGTNIQLQADGAININDAVSWSANKLTLTSGGNININANLTATGAGSLAFEYGQATAGGSGSAYAVANAAKIYIPQATAFTWKKGSAGTTNNLIFNNGNLRFGDGTQASLNGNGLLEQPWYFDNTSVVNGTTRNGWFQLTFSNYALNMEVGAGGDGTSSWNRNGQLLDSQTNLAGAVSNRSFDISGYREGIGTIVSSVTLGFSGGGESVRVDNTYTLSTGASFVKIDTNLTNVGGGAANNLRLWVGTQDDYVATRDSQFKYKGNLTANGFEQITSQNEQAKALKVTEFTTGEGAAILFYSTSDGADTSISTCCSFSNATSINPRSSLIFRGVDGSGNPRAEDGSYALFIRLPDLAVGQNGGMTWYYAAAPAAQLNAVVNTVAQSAGVGAPPPPTTFPQEAAIAGAQRTPVEVVPNISAGTNLLSPTAPPPTEVISDQGTLPVFDVFGGLALVPVTTSPTAGSSAGSTGYSGVITSGTIGSSESLSPSGANSSSSQEGDATKPNAETSSQESRLFAGTPDFSVRDPFGFMRVFVVDGGLNMPQLTMTTPSKTRRNNTNQ